MTGRGYIERLLMIAGAAAMLAAALLFGMGARWWSFYGLATVALATWPFLTLLLWKRLPEAGWSRWWTLVYAVPVPVLALVQIGYWSAFFAYGPQNPSLGVIREMLKESLGFALMPLLAAIGVALVLIFAAAGRTVRRVHAAGVTSGR